MDDFAQTVNMGAWYQWRMTNKFPDLAAAARMELSANVLKLIEPEFGDIDWDDQGRFSVNHEMYN